MTLRRTANECIYIWTKHLGLRHNKMYTQMKRKTTRPTNILHKTERRANKNVENCNKSCYFCNDINEKCGQWVRRRPESKWANGNGPNCLYGTYRVPTTTTTVMIVCGGEPDHCCVCKMSPSKTSESSEPERQSDMTRWPAMTNNTRFRCI